MRCIFLTLLYRFSLFCIEGNKTPPTTAPVTPPQANIEPTTARKRRRKKKDKTSKMKQIQSVQFTKRWFYQKMQQRDINELKGWRKPESLKCNLEWWKYSSRPQAPGLRHVGGPDWRRHWMFGVSWCGHFVFLSSFSVSVVVFVVLLFICSHSVSLYNSCASFLSLCSWSVSLCGHLCLFFIMLCVLVSQFFRALLLFCVFYISL